MYLFAKQRVQSLKDTILMMLMFVNPNNFTKKWTIAKTYKHHQQLIGGSLYKYACNPLSGKLTEGQFCCQESEQEISLLDTRGFTNSSSFKTHLVSFLKQTQVSRVTSLLATEHKRSLLSLKPKICHGHFLKRFWSD